jgi:ABC-type dipeptide/oligopeptide/nickel transport system permease component
MVHYIYRRVMLIPLVLLLVNFIGFAFAHITYQIHQSQTIYGSGREGITPVWPVYAGYVKRAIRGDFGNMPSPANDPLAGRVASASLASLGLLALVFVLSSLLGLAIGLAAIQVEPPRVMPWLAFISTTGLAMPSFYIGVLLSHPPSFHPRGGCVWPAPVADRVADLQFCFASAADQFKWRVPAL